MKSGLNQTTTMSSVQNIHPGCRICVILLSVLIFLQAFLLISSEASARDARCHSAIDQSHEIHAHHFLLQYEDSEEEGEGDEGDQGFAELSESSCLNESASWNSVYLFRADKSIFRFGLFILFGNLRN